mgnify:CR=1 FL=1
MKEELIQRLKNEGIWAKKSLGQNFLVDDLALNKIVEAAEVRAGDKILEIGPGLGVLTERLLERGAEVLAVEKDENLAGKLETRFSGKKLRVLAKDILDFDPNKNDLVDYKIVANIPYYITGRILEKFLSGEKKPNSMVILVQEEVANRICDGAGSMSLLSVSVHFYGKPEKVAKIPKESFFPVPGVNSAILKVSDIGIKYPKVDEKKFFLLVKMGFSSRRKTLLNNLKMGSQISSEELSGIIEKIGFNRLTRAQELSTGDWINLFYEIN